MKKLIALLTLLPALTSAEPESWMEKEKPDELNVSVRVASYCEVTKQQIVELTSGVLTRSRIKFMTESADLNMMVDLQCNSYQLAEGHVIFAIDVDFVRPVEVNGELFWARMGPAADYAMYGVEKTSEVLPAVREVIEEALTDYLRANFDLVEDDD